MPMTAPAPAPPAAPLREAPPLLPPHPRTDSAGETGLVALALGLLALACAVHPLWTLPSLGLALLGGVAGVRAVLRRGHRRLGLAGLAAAALALVVAGVTVPLTLRACVELLLFVARLRAHGG